MDRDYSKVSILNNTLSFFDCNAFIGKNKNPYTDEFLSAEMLCEKIGKSDLEKSLIYHSVSVLYDAAYGNQLLVEQAKEKSALFLVWVAVPEFFYTKEETKIFFNEVRKNKISALKIYPRYHDYIISNGALDDMFSVMQSENIPLLVAQEEIAWDEVNYIMEKYPTLNLVLQNVGYRMERIVSSYFKKFANFYIDISRYQVNGGIDYLCQKYGAERLLFGSGMPLFSPEPIMMMVDKAGISQKEKENIACKNMTRLLNHD